MARFLIYQRLGEGDRGAAGGGSLLLKHSTGVSAVEAERETLSHSSTQPKLGAVEDRRKNGIWPPGDLPVVLLTFLFPFFQD
jgi:hypothetical protein